MTPWALTFLVECVSFSSKAAGSNVLLKNKNESGNILILKTKLEFVNFSNPLSIIKYMYFVFSSSFNFNIYLQLHLGTHH